MDSGTTIDQQAADWVAREDRGPLSDDARLRRDAWLAADTRHLGAYARARAVFVAAGRTRVIGHVHAPTRRLRPRVLAWCGGIAASIAMVAMGMLLLALRPVSYDNGLGQISSIALPDGSRMVLNADSNVQVNFDAGQREVVLLRGEALFEVHKDPSRAFTVVAGRNRVTAIGTAFSVQRGASDEIRVVVREGLVDVIDSELPRPVRIAANFQAQARPGGRIDMQPLQPKELDRQLAWSHGMLAFDGDTLAQAAAQFARYSDLRILIDDPQIAQRRVVGLYAADDPEGFARAVASSLDLHVERDASGIHLRTAPIQTVPASSRH